MDLLKARGLYLDDLRPNPDPEYWFVVRTPAEFAEAVTSITFEAYSFDHDIAAFTFDEIGNESEITGYTLLVEYASYIPLTSKVFSHSANPVGKRKIEDYWRFYKGVHSFD